MAAHDGGRPRQVLLYSNFPISDFQEFIKVGGLLISLCVYNLYDKHIKLVVMKLENGYSTKTNVTTRENTFEFGCTGYCIL